MRWVKFHPEPVTKAERRLRYAVVDMLDVTDGDQEWLEDVIDLAEYQWRIVKE